MLTGSRSQFAEHKGVNKSTVSRWEKKGKLVFTVEGLVDFEKSDELIQATADPARIGVTRKHAQDRAEKGLQVAAGFDGETGLPASEPPAAKAAEVSQSAKTYDAFNQARADKEQELAKLARIKRQEQEGQLIQRSKVKQDIEAIVAIVAKGLTGLPSRLMPILNGEPDPGKREQLLESELRRVLTEFADAALTIDGDGELVSDA